jgi:preprotein translocase SecE subunit
MAAIYKKGQGYWTRMMSGIGFGLLIAMGAAWTWNQFKTVRIGTIEPVYVSATAAVIFLSVFGLLTYHFLGRNPKFVDFTIATEGEMKKVNWSTRREIVGSTWAVIGLTIIIALLCWVFDNFFAWVFQQIGVLQTAAGS